MAQYQIQYVDNTYRIVEWEKTDFNQVANALVNDKRIVVLENSLFELHSIRAIVFIPEVEPEPEDESQLSEYGHYDPETIAWLRANGVDISKGGK